MKQQSLPSNNRKKKYNRPQLKKYGKLAEITYGVAGSGFDAAGRRPN
jgi:hypothetical protein